MAATNRIKIELNTVVNGQGNIVDLKQSLVSLQQAISDVNKNQIDVVNTVAINQLLSTASDALRSLQSAMQGLVDTYAVQEEAERKLETVMRERMNATDEEIQKIKDLTAAQQEIGIIGDEVQLAGAQQIATFLKNKAALESLIPAMNDLVAQQKGFNATSGDAVNVANLMGKALMGNVSALTRVGIVFDEDQKKILQTGSEMERAATLAEVITQNVGHMNQELANTPSGQLKQFANNLGDLKEKLGGVVVRIQPVIAGIAQLTTATSGVVKLGNAIKALGLTMRAALISTGVGAAIIAIASGLLYLNNVMKKSREEAMEHKRALDDYKRSLTDVSEAAGRYAAERIELSQQERDIIKRLR